MKFCNWEYHLWHSFSWTEGLWEIQKTLEINIKEWFQWIKEYNELKKKMYWKNWKIFPQYKTTKFFLDNLDIYLKKEYANYIDPISYLYHLYYKEELSSIDIYYRLHELWNYNSKSKWTFERMFTITFWWELREKEKITNNLEKKLKHKNAKDAKWQKHKAEKEKEKRYKVAKTKKIIERIIKNIHPKDLNTKTIEEKKSIIKKIKYILSNDDNKFEEILLNVSDKYWLKVTVNAINEILEEKWYSTIKLNPWRIKETKKRLSINS